MAPTGNACHLLIRGVYATICTEITINLELDVLAHCPIKKGGHRLRLCATGPNGISRLLLIVVVDPSLKILLTAAQKIETLLIRFFLFRGRVPTGTAEQRISPHCAESMARNAACRLLPAVCSRACACFVMKHVRIGTAEVLKVRWNGVRNMVGGGERGSEPPIRLRAERRGGARRLHSFWLLGFALFRFALFGQCHRGHKAHSSSTRSSRR